MKVFKGSRIRFGSAHVSIGLEGSDMHLPLPLRLELCNHSPTGFEWGYLGSGPAQLALALCCSCVGDARGLAIHQEFKAKVISAIQADEWEMTEEQVVRVVEGLERAVLAGEVS
jgi:hypothetical protein